MDNRIDSLTNRWEIDGFVKFFHLSRIYLTKCLAGKLLNDLHKFDTLAGNWILFDGNTLPGAPAPRSSLGFASVGNLLYVFGGQTMEGVGIHDHLTKSVPSISMSPLFVEELVIIPCFKTALNC